MDIETFTIHDCLDNDASCQGTVERRPAMSPTGVWHPRCDKHFKDRQNLQRRLSRTYNIPQYY